MVLPSQGHLSVGFAPRSQVWTVNVMPTSYREEPFPSHLDTALYVPDILLTVPPHEAAEAEHDGDQGKATVARDFRSPDTRNLSTRWADSGL